MNISTKVLSAAAVIGFSLFASNSVMAAGEIDGRSNLLCAAFDVMACLDSGHCSRGEAREFSLPEFITVDVKQKAVTVTYDGKTANSPIKNKEISGNQLILQGVENNHGWTMAINRESGRMNVSSVGYEVSFTMFGACKAL